VFSSAEKGFDSINVEVYKGLNTVKQLFDSKKIRKAFFLSKQKESLFFFGKN
jgi:hypothetical protein